MTITAAAGPGIDVPTILYRLFNVADAVIYIGITDNLKLRMQQHARDQSWWAEVDHKTVEFYPTWRHAKVAETAAIKTEKPVYNLAELDPALRVKKPNLAAAFPDWSGEECRAILAQVMILLAETDVSHATARLRCLNFVLTGKDELPHGAALQMLARQCGVSRSNAFRALAVG